MKSSRWFFLLLLAFISMKMQGQSLVPEYQFTQTQGVYEEISGGNVVGNIDIDEQVFNNSTTGSSGTVTDIGFPIGFGFTYNNQVFDRFAIGTNGYIKLGTGTFPITGSVSTVFTDNFGDTLGKRNIIAAFHADLEGQTGSSIQYKTIGSAGAMELVVQWKKLMYYLSSDPDTTNFQIRLKQQGNVVEFCYGNFTRGAANKVASVGINGSFGNQVFMRRARIDSSETWATSNTSFSPNTKCDAQTNFKPVNGLHFSFKGLPPIPNDMSVVGIKLRDNISFGCPASTTEPVEVTFQNRGSDVQSNVLYTLTMNGAIVGSGITNFSPVLQPNETRTVPISETINLSSAATYNLMVYSSLLLDTGSYQGNDTLRKTIKIFAPAVVPFSSIRSLSEFSSRGWNFYNGNQKPLKSGSKFTALNYFFSATSAVQVNAFAAVDDTTNEWIVSPAFNPGPNMLLKFRAAITQFDTTSNVNNIGDDEMKIMISTDCGTTWQSLFTFNQASVTGGQLSKNKSGYVIPISSVVPFQLAFFVYNHGTNPLTTYYWHLDDVTMSQGNDFDLAARKVEVIGLGASGCSQTSFPVKVRLKNVGDAGLTSTDVSLRLNGGTALVQNFSFGSGLASGDSTEMTFPSVTITPNNNYRIVASAMLSSEDGFSAANDTTSIVFPYIGSTTPITLPNLIDFNGLPSGFPADWLVDQSSGNDFKIRARGVANSKSLSTNLFSGNKSAFAIMPSTNPLPAEYAINFNIRIVNDNGAAFTFGANDSVSIQASDNCGASFATLLKIDALNPLGINTFGTANIDLAPYAGKSISVKFDVKMNRTDFTGAWVDLDNINFSVNTAVATPLFSSQFEVFPNPANGNLNVRHSDEWGKSAYIIYDMQGKEVKSGKHVGNSTSIDIRNLHSGVYIFELISVHGSERKKIVIQ